MIRSQIFLLRPMLLVGLFLLAPDLQSQTRPGIKAGATLSSWDYAANSPDGFSQNSVANFTFSIVSETRLFGSFYLQTEPTYAKRTLGLELFGIPNLPKDSIDKILALGKDTNMINMLNGKGALEYTQELVSIDLPIHLKFMTSDSSKRIRGYFFAGPNISFRLSATVKPKFDTTGTGVEDNLDVTPSIKNTVVNWDVGAGVEIPLWSIIGVTVDFRKTFTKGDLIEISNGGKKIGDLRSNDFRLSLGLMLNL